MFMVPSQMAFFWPVIWGSQEVAGAALNRGVPESGGGKGRTEFLYDMFKQQGIVCIEQESKFTDLWWLLGLRWWVHIGGL